MDAPATDSFYDELADCYDLIFEDWEASMERQGEAIATLLGRYLPATSLRVLDAAAGIGTQSLPLAKRGYRVSSRDLSTASIARLQQGLKPHVPTALRAIGSARSNNHSIATPPIA